MKLCPNCGQPALDWHRFCMRCGMDITQVPLAPAQPYAAPAPPDPYAAQAQAAQPYYAPAPAGKSSNKSIWIIVGAVALLPALAIVLIIAAIAIPNLLRARIAANESSAVSSLRTINAGATAYQAEFNHYPEGLGSMGSQVAGVSREYGAGLIDNTLASGKKTGYVFNYKGIDSKHSGVLDDYEVTACPEKRNQSGVRCFYTDSTGIIRYSSTGVVSKESPALE